MSKRGKIGMQWVGLLLALAGGVYAQGPVSFSTDAAVQDVAESQNPPDAPTGGVSTRHRPHVEGELLVAFHPDTPRSTIESVHARAGAMAVESYPIVQHLVRVALPKGMSVPEAIEHYRHDPHVRYAERNFLVKPTKFSNDPMLSWEWGLYQAHSEAHINAPAAWDITTGSKDVVVAVVDTGVDYTHEDLAANMWHSADCNNDGRDDDGNGYIDDCYGIDTVNKDANPRDNVGHGTHVAGTIGAVGNNGIGVVGVNWHVGLMALKFMDVSASGAVTGTIADAIACLQYVQSMKDRGVKIAAVNASWGGGGYSQALYDAIKALMQRGILFMAAAGNIADVDDAGDNDAEPYYPASYALPNVIAVAATDQFDDVAWFSHYGQHSVHLAAPGAGIWSTVPGNAYDISSGTSMATPHVTGVAALLKAQNPSRDWRAIKNLLMSAGDTLPSLTETISGKRLDAHGALTCTNAPVLARLSPTRNALSVPSGTPVTLSVLHINCATPQGEVTVTVNPGNQRVTLTDLGLNGDLAANDGQYTALWTPPGLGTYTLIFPSDDGEAQVTVEVLPIYNYATVPFNWRSITGTSLDLSTNESRELPLPFIIHAGQKSFSSVFVRSDGTLSFTDRLNPSASVSEPIPTAGVTTLVAPLWQVGLEPKRGTGQNVFWAVQGTAPQREVVIEWRNVGYYSWWCGATATVRFQVVIPEASSGQSSKFFFNYADTTFGGTCSWADQGKIATVGVQVAADVGTQYSFHYPSLSNQLALLWTASTPTPANLRVFSSDPASVMDSHVAMDTVTLSPRVDTGEPSLCLPCR